MKAWTPIKVQPVLPLSISKPLKSANFEVYRGWLKSFTAYAIIPRRIRRFGQPKVCYSQARIIFLMAPKFNSIVSTFSIRSGNNDTLGSRYYSASRTIPHSSCFRRQKKAIPIYVFCSASTGINNLIIDSHTRCNTPPCWTYYTPVLPVLQLQYPQAHYEEIGRAHV